ncbi:MAG: DUF6498-containing protein [Pseudomonadota bacterium]
MDNTPHPIVQTGYKGLRRTVSLLVLVAVNLLPLAGVIFLGWDVAALMVLYWSENLILGFFTLIKMFVVSPLGALGMGSFFAIHYGGFCAVHGLFIAILLVDENIEPMPGEPWPLFLVFIQLLVNVVRQVLAHAPPEWIFAFGALFISHGVSFVFNFLLARERDDVTLKKLMGAPYGRIVVLHIAVLFGGFAIAALGQPVLMLVVLVLVKLGIDVALHLREHKGLAARRASEQPIP